MLRHLVDNNHGDDDGDYEATNIPTHSNHILHALLPPSSTASENCSLRHREHSFLLPERSSHLSDCNFFLYAYVIQELILGPVTVLVFFVAVSRRSLCLIVFVLCRCACCHAFFYNEMILILILCAHWSNGLAVNLKQICSRKQTLDEPSCTQVVCRGSTLNGSVCTSATMLTTGLARRITSESLANAPTSTSA